jgi:hypothetical protein
MTHGVDSLQSPLQQRIDICEEVALLFARRQLFQAPTGTFSDAFGNINKMSP